MYTRYFGLTDKPFAISPDPRYLFMSERHREALAHLLYGIESDGCIFLLTGDVGTGKTTICRCLLDQLPERTDIAIILNPKLTARDLLRTICDELDIAPERDTVSIKTYIDILNQHLLRAHAEGRATALIIDEAQNLEANVLEQLRLLTNLETNSHKLLQIFLIGQPELRNMLNKKGMDQINQRVTGRYHLSPLDPADVTTYIHHRLRVAGCSQANLISDRAIKHVVKVTRGIPRLINVLCDRALLGAYAENADHVDLQIMKQAAKEVFPKTGRMFSFTGRELGLGGILLALILAALLLPQQIRKFTSNPDTGQNDTKHTPHNQHLEKALPSQEELPVPQHEQTAPVTAQQKTEKTASTTAPETPDQIALPTLPKVELTQTSTHPEPPAPPAAEVVLEPTPLTEPAPPNPLHIQPPMLEEQAPESIAESSGLSEFSHNSEQGDNIIKISAPLIVLEQAGPIPEKKVMELILR